MREVGPRDAAVAPARGRARLLAVPIGELGDEPTEENDRDDRDEKRDVVHGTRRRSSMYDRKIIPLTLHPGAPFYGRCALSIPDSTNDRGSPHGLTAEDAAIGCLRIAVE